MLLFVCNEFVVTMCHRFTPPEQLKAFCLNADIIVTATGIPKLIKADMVKEGACIIDVGITRVNDPETGKTKLVGDVDFDGMLCFLVNCFLFIFFSYFSTINIKNSIHFTEVQKIAGYITPVPGGVGPMTVTMLMKNTFLAAQNLEHLREMEGY